MKIFEKIIFIIYAFSLYSFAVVVWFESQTQIRNGSRDISGVFSGSGVYVMRNSQPQQWLSWRTTRMVILANNTKIKPTDHISSVFSGERAHGVTRNSPPQQKMGFLQTKTTSTPTDMQIDVAAPRRVRSRSQDKDVYMWDELCDTPAICESRCQQRYPCISYEWKTNTECHMFRANNHEYPRTRNELSFETVDCTKCSCSLLYSSMHKAPQTRQEACSLLEGTTVQFTGDSLMRDQWTMLGIWLASLEMDIFDGRDVERHAMCMINAWKFLKYLNVDLRLKKLNLFSDRQGPEFRVCHGTVRLRFAELRTFQEIRHEFDDANSFRNVDLFIVGAGIHQMVTYGENEDEIHNFITWLNAKAEALRGKTSMIYVGSHRRIIERAPTPYRAYAAGPQGNKKIRRWNSIFCDHLKNAQCIDPFSVTESLPVGYSDTEDGMHMGAWVNLQKVHLILQRLSQALSLKKNISASSDRFLGKHTNRAYQIEDTTVSNLLHRFYFTNKNQTRNFFLSMCMPTTPRGENVTYLTQTLAALSKQMQGSVLADFVLTVVNTRPGQHPEFENAKKVHAGNPSMKFHSLSTEQARWIDPDDTEVDNYNNPSNKPGPAVRRQNMDLTHVMQQCASTHSTYTMLLEDDFLPNSFALKNIKSKILLEQTKQDWKTMSFSFGMNGIVMRTNASFTQFAQVLLKNYNVLPCDILVYTSDRSLAYAGRDIRHDRSAFRHIGKVSTFSFRNSEKFLSLYGKSRTF